MANKHYPVIRTMTLGEPALLGRSQRLIDIGKVLSKTNRRLYRQGRYYEAKIDLESDSNTEFEVYALRDDWAVQKAYQMAYTMYLKATKDERETMIGRQVARWEDFRIDHALAQPNSEVGPLFYTEGLAPLNLAGQGEFELSTVIDGNGVRRTFTWGPFSGTSSYSLLDEYDKAGNTESSPDSFVAGAAVPYDNLNTEVDAHMADDLEDHGNNPPYDKDGVNRQSPWVKIATLSAANPNAQRLSTGFFTAPCGLIVLKQAANSDIREKYSLTVKKGDYKGVHAPSMLDMNKVVNPGFIARL